MKNEIVIFEDGRVKLDVNLQDETVWLTQKQIADLFGRDRTVITKHINNIFKEGELVEKVVCAKFAHTEQHGAIKEKTQEIESIFYNLDMIISVGYRVNSKRGIAFRKWASEVLKEYLLKGYAVNLKRLEVLEKTVQLIDIASRNTDEANDKNVKDVLNVINKYMKALNLLDDYDHKNITKPKGTKSAEIITYENCLSIINSLKYNEKSEIFGLERNKGLNSIINNVFSSFDNKDLYETTEEKAANFLYLVVKDHVFIDGNKRIAATLFIFFLFYYDILYKEDTLVIDNNTLAALTLLIASSKPSEKDIIVSLIMNTLVI